MPPDPTPHESTQCLWRTRHDARSLPPSLPGATRPPGPRARFAPGAILALAALTLAATPVQSQDAAGDTAARAGANTASWDVSAPPYALRSIDLDVSEGTWISLDVSPDGTEIVFDLLGDLYTIPMEGGDARPLTERPNDQQDVNEPAFSPDGRFLYFSQDMTPGPTSGSSGPPPGGWRRMAGTWRGWSASRRTSGPS